MPDPVLRIIYIMSNALSEWLPGIVPRQCPSAIWSLPQAALTNPIGRGHVCVSSFATWAAGSPAPARSGHAVAPSTPVPLAPRDTPAPRVRLPCSRAPWPVLPPGRTARPSTAPADGRVARFVPARTGVARSDFSAQQEAHQRQRITAFVEHRPDAGAEHIGELAAQAIERFGAVSERREPDLELGMPAQARHAGRNNHDQRLHVP